MNPRLALTTALAVGLLSATALGTSGSHPCLQPGPGDDCAAADLRGLDLRGHDLRRANLRGARLGGSRLSGARLDGADLRGASLHGTDLRRATLRGADLSGARIGTRSAVASPGGARVNQIDPCRPTCWRTNLSGANLAGADLTGAVFVSTNLTGANLSRTVLTGAAFGGAILTDANVTQAATVTMTSSSVRAGATFIVSTITGATFANANLTGTTWRDMAPPAPSQAVGAVVQRIFYVKGTAMSGVTIPYVTCTTPSIPFGSGPSPTLETCTTSSGSWTVVFSSAPDLGVSFTSTPQAPPWSSPINLMVGSTSGLVGAVGP